MKNRLAFLCSAGVVGLAAIVQACSGDTGPAGAPGAAGTAGANGADGKNGTNGKDAVTPTPDAGGDAAMIPEFSISPDWSYLGRTTGPITITTTSPNVDFTVVPPSSVNFVGTADINARDIKVLNAKSFQVSVSVTNNADTQPHTVAFRVPYGTAPDGGKQEYLEFKAPNAFAARSPVSMSVDGDAVQGGRVTVTLKNTDNLPFDANSIALLRAPLPPFVDMSAADFSVKTPGFLQFTARLDPLAPVGGLQVGAGNYSLGGGSPDTVYWSNREDVKIAATTPKPITPGTPITGETVKTPLGTVLYKLAAGATAGASKLWDVGVTGTGTSAAPAMWLTASSGRAMDVLRAAGTSSPYVAPSRILLPFDTTTGDLFLTVGDAHGQAGAAADIGWTVDATEIAATSVAEQSTAHPESSPQAITASGAVVISGQIASQPETDAYMITLSAPAKVTVSVTRRNFLGDVDVSADPAFATKTTLPSTDTMWNAQATTSAPSAVWYVRASATNNYDLTSYVLAVKPE